MSIVPPTTEEEYQAQLAAAIKASEASAAEYEEFAEVLGAAGDAEIAENEAEYLRACEESKREHEELELALRLSALDLAPENVDGDAHGDVHGGAHGGAHGDTPTHNQAFIDACRQLDAYVETLYNELYSEESERLAQEISNWANRRVHPDEIIRGLRLREYIDERRVRAAVAKLAADHIRADEVYDVMMGAPRRHRLELPE